MHKATSPLKTAFVLRPYRPEHERCWRCCRILGLFGESYNLAPAHIYHLALLQGMANAMAAVGARWKTVRTPARYSFDMGKELNVQLAAF